MRIVTKDGIGLHVEEAGEGCPILFIHEFGGNHATRRVAMPHPIFRRRSMPIRRG